MSEKKFAIITGASSGIGRELAYQLAKQGFFVGVLARRENELKKLCAEIKKAGGSCAYAVCDVTDAQKTKKAIDALITEANLPLTWIFANAGYSEFINVQNFNLEAANQVISINLLGVIHTVAAALPYLLKQNSGSIIVTSSIAGSIGIPGAGPYCASKAGVNAFCESLRRDLLKTNIRVTSICPGFIKTPMIEKNNFSMPLVMETEFVAKKMIAAAYSGKKRVIFPKRLYLLTLFGHFAPDWLWRMVPVRAL